MKKSKDSWKFVYILARIEIDKEKTTWILILSQYKFKFGNCYLQIAENVNKQLEM